MCNQVGKHLGVWHGVTETLEKALEHKKAFSEDLVQFAQLRYGHMAEIVDNNNVLKVKLLGGFAPGVMPAYYEMKLSKHDPLKLRLMFKASLVSENRVEVFIEFYLDDFEE